MINASFPSTSTVPEFFQRLKYLSFSFFFLFFFHFRLCCCLITSWSYSISKETERTFPETQTGGIMRKDRWMWMEKTTGTDGLTASGFNGFGLSEVFTAFQTLSQELSSSIGIRLHSFKIIVNIQFKFNIIVLMQLVEVVVELCRLELNQVGIPTP